MFGNEGENVSKKEVWMFFKFDSILDFFKGFAGKGKRGHVQRDWKGGNRK